MSRLIAWLSVVLVALTPVFAQQEQVVRELPLQFASAVEIMDLFSVKEAPAPPSSDLGSFARRCLTAAFADFPRSAATWQSFSETQSDLRAALPGAPPAPLAKMLPGDLAPPTLGTRPNSLRLHGTADQIDKFREILDLLDKPAKRISLRVEVFRPRDLPSTAGIDWSITGDKDSRGGPTVVGFARIRYLELFKQATGAVTPALLDASVTTHNNTIAELRFAEVLPSYTVAQPDAKPLPTGYARCVRLDLIPRYNADNSITVYVNGDWLAGATKAADASILASPGEGPLLSTQIRLGLGETALMGNLRTAGTVTGSPVPAGGMLTELVVAITPCLQPM